MYILHVSAWFHLPGPLWLLPDVVFIIYPASIGQYWKRLSALLPYWQQDNVASNRSGSEKEEEEEEAEEWMTAFSIWTLNCQTFMKETDSLESAVVISEHYLHPALLNTHLVVYLAVMQLLTLKVQVSHGEGG